MLTKKYNYWVLLSLGILFGTLSCILVEEERPKDKFYSGKFYPDIVSERDLHSKKGFDCLICHEELKKFLNKTERKEAKPEDAKPILSMDICVDCHKSYGQKVLFFTFSNHLVDCRTCHINIRTDKRPKSHYQNWKKTHKTQATWEERCHYCHGKSSCIRCHRSQKPKTHNNFWRQRSHGLMSAVDREKCMNCHTEDYCIRCHIHTTPKNHTGVWGSSRNLHCMQCHEPLSSRDNNCSVCHRNAFNHRNIADPMPHGFHQVVTTCSPCHARIPHPDNGQNCRICHRVR